ncbi:hypothetical protein D9756_006807 [Leucocoprinus leucothites]|uniref:Uncharacterized protein n=1 Tax=Leucocoprinus leucothites TaxID=201217 RepID=A0A8H5G1X6_9AGAR|nr:hypothetical protein D9756_006807 [Leucoagaricus leucothites]
MLGGDTTEVNCCSRLRGPRRTTSTPLPKLAKSD